MFKGRVEKVSHEGGLLVSYSGACPALGSVMVDSSETYIGKVDGVIGNLNNSLVHIAHLDRQANPQNMIGLEITIRTRKPRDNQRSRDNQGRDDRRDSRSDDRRGDRRDGRRDNRRDGRRGDRRERNDRRGRDNSNNRDWECSKCSNSNFAFRTECNRCGEPKGRGGRNNAQREQRSRKETHSNNDWTCGECQNSNFSFRNECNRCGAPKGRGRDRGSTKKWKGDDRRPGDRNEPQPRAGDWDCPQCGKSNFAKRNDCFGCGRSKRVGGPKQRGHHRRQKDPPPLHSAKYGRGKRRER